MNKNKIAFEELEKKIGKEKLRKLELKLKEGEDETIELVVRVPERHVSGQILKFMRNDPLKAQEIAVNNCLLTDKELVNANDYLFFACALAIIELIPIQEGQIKKF
jgi:hypothetical protein